MVLRELELKDAKFMLEWMQDRSINQVFKFDFDSCTIEDVENFIKGTKSDKSNYHFAIINDQDEYLGTISIKDIDLGAKKGEYAIVLRKCAHGKGVSKFATHQILKFAFEELNLERVYLNVASDNKKAIGFYEKYGFIFEGEFKKHLMIRGQIKDIRWYRMLKGEYMLLK